jgi:hypothetical protein
MKTAAGIIALATLALAAGEGQAQLPAETCSIMLTPEQERVVNEAEGGNAEITLTEEQVKAMRRVFPRVVVDKLTISKRHLRGTQKGGCEVVVSSEDGVTMAPQPSPDDEP